MKKLYAFAAMAVLALSANAQLYICGAGEGLDWDAANPMVVNAENGKYTVTINSLSSFKISTAYGDWDQFNAYAKCCSLTEDNLGTAVALEDGDSNINTPWQGNYTLVIPTDMSTLTATTTTAKPTSYDIYIRGGMNNWCNDGFEDTWKFTQSTDENVYIIEITEANPIYAGVEFKIADTSWGNINYSVGELEFVPSEFGEMWYFNHSSNTALANDFTGTIEFNIPETNGGEAFVLMIAGNAGVEGITVDNSAVKEYFNLQGVRVDNPENGLYILRQGNTVKKVMVK